MILMGVKGMGWGDWTFRASLLGHRMIKNVTFLFFKDIIYLFLEKGEGKE